MHSQEADKRKSRYKRHRLKKRLWMIGLPTVLIVGGLLATAGIAFKSEAFWKKVVLPRYFGEFWETSLQWESMTPHLFSPGVTLKDVTLIDPESNTPALFIAELDVRLAPTLNFDSLTIKQLDLRNVVLNLDYNEEGISGLDRAIARLYEGTFPRESTRRIDDGPIVPSIDLRSFSMEGLSIRYRERRFEGIELTTTFNGSPNPIQMTLSEGAAGFSPGRIDEFARWTTSGAVRGALNGVTFEADSQIAMTLTDLRRFPESKLGFDVVFDSLEKDAKAEGNITLDLQRMPVRPIATVLDSFDIKISDGSGEGPLFTIPQGSFDPLTGELDMTAAFDGRLDNLRSAILAFVGERSKADFAALLDETVFLSPQDEGLARHLGGEIEIRSRGLNQYAIVDDREQLPLELKTSGVLRIDDVYLPGVDEFRAIVAGEANSDLASNPFAVDGELTWFFEMDEVNDTGAILFSLDLTPQNLTTNDVGVSLALSNLLHSGQPVSFKPSGVARLADFDHLLSPSSDAFPQYQFLPEYEALFGFVAGQMRFGHASMEALGLENAGLLLRVDLRDSETLRAVLEPVVGEIDTVADAHLVAGINRGSIDVPIQWFFDLEVDELELKELPGLLKLEGRSELIQSGNLLTIEELYLALIRLNPDQDTPVVLSLGLVEEQDSVWMGPRSPSFINLRTGEGTLRLTADTLNRDIMEVAMKIQSFGLSESLAEPFYQRLLDMMGFRPGDTLARGEAKGTLVLTMGEQLGVTTIISMRNIPAANFLPFASELDAESELLDVLFQQSSLMDRQSLLVTPQAFLLRSRLSENGTPVFRLALNSDPNTRLDYADLKEFARIQFEEEEVDLGVGPLARLSSVAVSFFDRIEKLNSAVRGGSGSLVLTIPGLEVSSLTKTFQAARLPIESGRLDLEITAGLDRLGEGRTSLADGSFVLRDLRLKNLDQTLPPAVGSMKVIQDGNTIRLQDMHTSFLFAGEDTPTRFAFEGNIDTKTFDSDWSFRIDGLVEAALTVLASVEDEAVAGISTILKSLPTDALTRSTDSNHEVVLLFEGESNAATATATVRATQIANGLELLPAEFGALGFTVEQVVRYSDREGTQLVELSGVLREEGIPEPVASITLDRPVSFSRAEAGVAATIRLAAQNDLSRFATRLRSYPIPLFQKPIVAGVIKGAVEIVFPDGILSSDMEALSVQNRLSLSGEGIELEGFDDRIDIDVDGVIRKELASLFIDNLLVDLSVAGRSSGELSFAGNYDLNSDNLDLVIRLKEARADLIRALPDQYRSWVQSRSTVLDITSHIAGQPRAGIGMMDFILAARQISLPSIELPEGGIYTHPPLSLDIAFGSLIDRNTRMLVLDDLLFRLASDGDSRFPARPLFTVEQLGGVAIDLETGFPTGVEGESGGLRAELGPIDISEYAPLLYQLLGSPVGEGTLSGELVLNTIGSQDVAENTATGYIALSEAIWSTDSIKRLPFAMQVKLEALNRGSSFLLESLHLTADFPEAEPDRRRDDLELAGYFAYDLSSGAKDLEVTVASAGLSLDRVIDMALSAQEKKEQFVKAEVPSATAEDIEADLLDGFDLLANTTIKLVGNLRNLHYRDIWIRRADLLASYDDNHLALEKFESVLDKGTISMSGDLTRKNGELPWSFAMLLEKVSVAPILKSFTGQDTVLDLDGTIGGRASLRAPGLKPSELAELDGRIIVDVREGTFENKWAKRVLGDEAPIEANLRVLIGGNRAAFDLRSPWNMSRELNMRGVVRDLVPAEGDAPSMRAVADYRRLTDVGPIGRYEVKGERKRRFRQTLYGVMVEIDGPTEALASSASLRTFHY